MLSLYLYDTPECCVCQEVFCLGNAAVLVFGKGFRGMRANDVRPYGEFDIFRQVWYTEILRAYLKR